MLDGDEIVVEVDEEDDWSALPLDRSLLLVSLSSREAKTSRDVGTFSLVVVAVVVVVVELLRLLCRRILAAVLHFVSLQVCYVSYCMRLLTFRKRQVVTMGEGEKLAR